jgi:hypothetical protein
MIEPARLEDRSVLRKLRRWVGRFIQRRKLSKAVRRRIILDHQGLPADDPGNDAVIQACTDWLCAAQDNAPGQDGGVARAYDIRSGWQPSYPETTGYIVPTMLQLANDAGRADLQDRARRMLDWLVSIQLPMGAFQGGMISSTPVVPVVFNTGQILIGLAAGEVVFGGYASPLRRAADWLLAMQDSDGAWRKGSSPFAAPGEKTYDTHVAWGLIEAAHATGEAKYVAAAEANVRWALQYQAGNGWLRSCCLTNPSRPLTHTLGYALRGILEVSANSRDPLMLDSARRLGLGLVSAMRADGFLPGQLHADWSPGASWSCLTGTAQVAICWLILFQRTGDRSFLDAAVRANRYLRRTVAISGPDWLRGGVRGSFPIDGAYCHLQYPNWAAKFLIDALLLERDISSNYAVR